MFFPIIIAILPLVAFSSISICHENDDGKWVTKTIDENEWQKYEMTSDYLGNCVAATATDRPTDAPTFRPTKTPTNTPTARPTNTPTARPTSKPTDTPTARPSVMICPQSVMQIALDRSRSINKQEMVNQKDVIDALVDILDIRDTSMSIAGK